MTDEDGDPVDEELEERVKEQEARRRRIFDYDRNSFDFRYLRVTDAGGFSHRTFLPTNKDPRVEMQNMTKKNSIM